MVLEGSISKVTQELDEMRLKQQKIKEESKRLRRKRMTRKARRSG